MSTFRNAALIHSLAAIVLAALVGAAVFSTLTEYDRWGPNVLGSGTQPKPAVAITGFESREGALASKEAVAAYARNHGLNIYKLTLDNNGSVRSTQIHAFVGDRDSLMGNLDTQSFPSFGSKYATTFYPADDLDVDRLTGTYVIQGTPEDAAQIVDMLTQEGTIATSLLDPPEVLTVPLMIMGSTWSYALIISIFALAATGFYLSSVRLQVRAIRDSLGVRPLVSGWSEFAAIASRPLIAALAIVTLLIGYVSLTRSGYRLPTVIAVGVVFLLGLLALSGASYFMSQVFRRRHSIGELLKGKRPTVAIAGLSIVTIALACAFMTSAVSSVAGLQLKEKWASVAEEYFDGGRELYAPVIGHALASGEADDIITGLGGVNQRMAKERDVYLSNSRMFSAIREPEPIGGNDGPLPSDVLVVNPLFAGSLPQDNSVPPEVLDRADESEQVVIVVPARYSAHADELERMVQEWVQFRWELVGLPLPADLQVSHINVETTGVVPVLDNDGLNEMHRVDPVLVVIGDDSGALPDGAYGELRPAVHDRNTYLALVDEAGLGHAVVSMQSLSSAVALEKANRAAEISYLVVAAVALLIVLILSTLVVTTVYRVKNAPSIFLMQTTGSSFWRIHGRYLAAVGVASALASAAIAVRQSIDPVLGVAVVTGLAAGTSGIAAGILALTTSSTHRRALETT